MGRAIVAVLMDVRDELQRLNRLLHCHNLIEIPQTLKRVEKNTRKNTQKKKRVGTRKQEETP